MRWLPLLLLLVLPAAVQAQFDYTTDGSTITITRYTGLGGAVTIPDTINNLPVAGIGISAFYYCTDVTGVTIPDSVTSIGMYAFAYCINLADINIPNNVTSIDYAAFRCCTNLTGITLPASVSSIGSGVFYSCDRLTAITVDASNPLYSSTNGVLFNRHQTRLIQYPGGKTGGYTVPDSVTSIETYAFASCAKLTGVTLPAGVKSIGDSAFLFSTNLANVAIPDSVTSIGTYAFASCAGLTNATIGAGVTSIGIYAFSSCASLAAITVHALNPSYSSTNGVLFNKNQSSLIQYPGGRAGSYMVPNGVANIGSYAFAYCGSLNSVTLPDTVTNIEPYAFASCTGLTNIAIGNGLTTIVDWTFPDCTNLATISMGGSVTNISKEAFRSCTNLTGLYFQGNAPSLGYPAQFTNDTKATVYYLPGTTGWSSTFGGRPTALWLPQVLTGDASFGVRTNQFGFHVAWASGRVVVVEACTNLSNSIWSPLQTNTLTDVLSYFSDPDWTNYPGRFYRLRSP